MRKINELDEFVSRTVPKRKEGRPYDTKPLLKKTTCQNHSNKSGDYEIILEDGQPDYFCEGCAAKLTTKGFDVRPVVRPQQSRHAGDPIYEQIMSYLTEFNHSIFQHEENIKKFSSLNGHYCQQSAMVQACYDEIIEIIEEMKRDHLADIANEREKYVQTAAIEIGHLQDNLNDLQVSRTDIESNLDQVVEGMKQSSEKNITYRQCMNNYYQNLQLYANQIEQQQLTLDNVLNYRATALADMPKQIEVHLDSMWQEALSPTVAPSRKPLVARNDQKKPLLTRPKPLIVQNVYTPIENQRVMPNPYANNGGMQVNIANQMFNQTGGTPSQNTMYGNQQKQSNLPLMSQNSQNIQQNQQMTVKHIHQILPKAATQQEGKKAFRNLAMEEQMLLEGKTSPMFKQI